MGNSFKEVKKNYLDIFYHFLFLSELAGPPAASFACFPNKYSEEPYKYFFYYFRVLSLRFFTGAC